MLAMVAEPFSPWAASHQAVRFWYLSPMQGITPLEINSPRNTPRNVRNHRCCVYSRNNPASHAILWSWQFASGFSYWCKKFVISFSTQIIRRALVVLRSVIHWLRELWSITLKLIEFGCVYKLYPLNRIVRIPAVRQLVTETSLIACQCTVYRRQCDRLSSNQFSFLATFSYFQLFLATFRLPSQTTILDCLLDYRTHVIVVFKLQFSFIYFSFCRVD